MQDELFEVFDDAGRPAGLARRAHVHAVGLWHRSAHVFLFTPDGALFLQQRAPTKDLFPGRWDLSVGEHLQPGEDYLNAAVRGLREELGITGVALEPLGDARHYRLDVPELGIADHELQCAFRGTTTCTPEPDGVEVSAIRAVTAVELAAWIARDPDAFTPWLLEELHERHGLGAFGLD